MSFKGKKAKRVPPGGGASMRGGWGGCLLLGVSLVTLCGLTATPVWGQCGVVNLTVIMDRGEPPIELFRVGDFPLEDSRLHPQLFTIVITSETECEVIMRLEVESDRYGLLGSGETLAFDLPAGVTTIRNRELTDTRGDYDMPDFDTSPGADDLQERILDTGYLPEDRYCFTLILRESDSGDELTRGQGCLAVTNPLGLEILRPGQPFDDVLPLVVSRHPQFQWSSQARRWLFELCEAQPGDGAGEDVMENSPVFRTELACDGIDPTLSVDCGPGRGGALSWSYPSAAEDLERGRTYCWRITSLIEASGGPEEVSSEIFCFRLCGPGDLAAEPVTRALEMIMAELLRMVGPELERMTPTGTVLVDGEAVDPSVLQEIAEGISGGRYEIRGAEIR